MKFDTVEALVAFVSKGLKLPEWQKQLFAKYRKEIQVHSRGELFYKVDRLFPNEHPNSKAHRVLSFESVTRGSFWKGVNNVLQIFQNSSYSVEASEKTVEFITAHNFEKKNLFSFFLEKWCHQALSSDPNSLIVVYPFEFIKDKNFSQVTFVPTERILHIDNDLIVFESEEESEKSIDVRETKVTLEKFFDQSIDKMNFYESEKNTFAATVEVKLINPVIHAFTANGFYRMQQDPEDSTKMNYAFWKHNKGFIPVVSTGGMETGNGVNESFFSVFCPFGNLALLQHSQHTAVNFMFSFPRMSEIEIPCDNPGCFNGEVACEIDKNHPSGRKPCKKCGGNGYLPNQTPYKVYRKRLDPNMIDEKTSQILNYDDVKFYTPNTAILDYSKGEWKDYLESAEASVYVPQKQKTGHVESAKSKEVDREDRFNFLSKISKVFYDRLRFVVQCFENYTVNNPAEVTVNIPFSFQIISEEEAFKALQDILVSDAPVLIKANQIENFINKFISQSSPLRKVFAVLKKVDMLLFYSDLQIQAQKAANIITSIQWSIHVFSFPVLAKMVQEDRSILEMSEDDLVKKLLTELKNFEPKENDLKQTLLDKFNPTQ